MEFMKTEPYLVLVYLLLVCMTDIYSGQRIDLVKDSCTGPDEIEILRKELVVLSQVVKDQAIRIDIMEKALTSVKQECCQLNVGENLLSSSESSSTSTLTTTQTSVISTASSKTQGDDTTDPPASIGNTGRKFLILFMDSNVLGGLRFYVTTNNETILSIISSDYLSSSIKAIVDRTIIVISDSNFTLPPDLAYNSLTVEPKAVLLQTTELLAVTAFNDNNMHVRSSYGSLIIPTDKLSTKYLVSSMEPRRTSQLHYSQFAIGALFDMTNIKITFKMKKRSSISLSDGNYSDGDVYSITLERLETFTVRHTTDLTGTLITSSKPMAVFSGNTCQEFKNTRSCSNTVTQLPPVNQFDNQYIVPNFYTHVVTLIQVVSEHQSNINVTIGGGHYTWFLDERDFKNMEVTYNETIVIVSDQPVLVSAFGMIQSIKIAHDPYMTVIPGVHQYLDFYKITVQNGYTENYMCVIIPQESKDNLRINDLHVNLNTVVYESTSVLFTTTYVVQIFEVEAGTSVLSTTDNSAFGLIVYGHRFNDWYSFAGTFVFP